MEDLLSCFGLFSPIHRGEAAYTAPLSVCLVPHHPGIFDFIWMLSFTVDRVMHLRHSCPCVSLKLASWFLAQPLGKRFSPQPGAVMLVQHRPWVVQVQHALLQSLEILPKAKVVPNCWRNPSFACVWALADGAVTEVLSPFPHLMPALSFSVQCKMSVNGQRGECWCVDPIHGKVIQGAPTIRGDPECHLFYTAHEQEDRGAHALRSQ